ncbi:MAG TPA: STAS domain-containing protein [Nonomuraea sp.]|nr:STAS domain-containing protein [Nonomuraea sp.]
MDEDSGSAERFTISIGLHETFIVATAVGELDYNSAGLLRQQVKNAWEATDSAGLVLDLSGVTFCDSMGVGVLVLLLRQSREQHRNLVLSSLPPLLERILTITGLRTASQVEASVEEAIQTVQASPPHETTKDADAGN